ncbi:MAG: prepilin-type N-terminal cleavage/methylation domain-containing protein [Acaryochloridaceae cyanobacterium SU_2_1]|nr:prepilin-type N-terminal cleavage/methylation domain-containing protein [Acaryochloridaceae cyanobacterium SU_2_1]
MHCEGAARQQGQDTGGFTLPEVIAVVVILGVLAALGVPSLLSLWDQYKVDQALAQVHGALRETQAIAISKGKSCTISIPKGIHQTLVGSCLVTGDRNLGEVEIDHLRPSPWVVTFNYKGQNRSPSNDPGTLWLSLPNDTVQPRCLTLSVGIGLMRTGNYDPLATPQCQTD